MHEEVSKFTLESAQGTAKQAVLLPSLKQSRMVP